MISQRSIYDARYADGSYDERSVVHVLTAERTALIACARAALGATPAGSLTLLDFGYGTGRVTNEFAVDYQLRFGPNAKDLRVVAYDVSFQGLQVACRTLVDQWGFSGEPLEPRVGSEGYLAGTVSRVSGDNVTTTVVFVHGDENAPPSTVGDLLRSVNNGNPYHITSSWYSALGHIPGRARRNEFFRMLGGLTDPRGEFIMAVSTTGDLVDAQREWAERIGTNEIGDLPIEVPGDVMYDTELGQQNYYHIFGTELAELLGSISSEGQHSWVEAIRMPDPEFDSRDAELANYRRVRAFNGDRAGHPWMPGHYEAVHTIAAIRSGTTAATPRYGYSGGDPDHPAEALLRMSESSGR